MTAPHTVAGHTAGPWNADDFTVWATDGTGTVNRFSLRVEGGYVWRKQGWSPAEKTTDAELLANVALIAAAPDLLAALQTLLKRHCDEADAGPDFFGADEEPEVIAARAAIAKATAARQSGEDA